MAAEFKHGDYVKGGWELVKPNLVPSLVATIGLCIPILGVQVAVNYMKAIKEAKASGKAIEIGALFDFANFVNNFVAMIIVGVLNSCCFLLGPLFLFVPCILADHPGVGFMDAIKASLAFGKANFVPSLIFMLVCGVVIIVAEIACVLPVLIAIPIVLAGIWLAYVDHRAAIHAAAAEAGITLA